MRGSGTLQPKTGGGPYGDTRVPDSPWYALACEIRDRIFRVQESPGYTKQCDKCHGWPLLDTEPQTTDLAIYARSDSLRAFRSVVLEQYWECIHCSQGVEVQKCDWCCEKFPERECCNYMAHDDPDSWQADLLVQQGQCVADAGLRGVKHLSMGCKTRWTDIKKADKILQAKCPACSIQQTIDREGDYVEFVSKHMKVCDGVPQPWIDLATNPEHIALFFKEDAARSGLRVYQKKATEVVQELLQMFNPDGLKDQLNEAQLERKRARQLAIVGKEPSKRKRREASDISIECIRGADLPAMRDGNTSDKSEEEEFGIYPGLFIERHRSRPSSSHEDEPLLLEDGTAGPSSSNPEQRERRRSRPSSSHEDEPLLLTDATAGPSSSKPGQRERQTAGWTTGPSTSTREDDQHNAGWTTGPSTSPPEDDQHNPGWITGPSSSAPEDQQHIAGWITGQSLSSPEDQQGRAGRSGGSLTRERDKGSPPCGWVPQRDNRLQACAHYGGAKQEGAVEKVHSEDEEEDLQSTIHRLTSEKNSLTKRTVKAERHLAKSEYKLAQADQKLAEREQQLAESQAENARLVKELAKEKVEKKRAQDTAERLRKLIARMMTDSARSSVVQGSGGLVPGSQSVA